MKKADKDLLIQEINKSSQTGHQVTKLYTSSHSERVIRVGCSCGNQHPILSSKSKNNFDVIWKTNLEIKWGMQ